jgi:hypothetical protein
VIDIFQRVKIALPGVKKRLKTMVISSKKKIVFMPLKMNLGGTLESLIHITKNRVASKYPTKLLTTKRDMIKMKVVASLTLGSSLCITESVL